METVMPQNEVDMKVHHISVSEIYSDPDFNIRGEIDRANIVSLARDIDSKGLLQPITIQPRNDPKFPDKKYRVVVGNRRFEAYQFLERETVPCIIKENLSDIDALSLNFTENIERQNLNILQEAQGIDRFIILGLTLNAIADITKQGKNWVNIRYSLLSMPENIQQDAAAGFITQGQIRDLAEIKNPNEQLKIVKAIKEARFRGESRLPIIKKKKTNPTVRKRRSPDEIYDMMDHILEEMKSSNLATRSLAWANGEISDLDLYRDLIEYSKENNLSYQPPPEVANLIFSVPKV